MMLSALALSLVVVHSKSPLDEKVTFTNPGLAVPQLMQELSRAAHVPLFAPKAFQNDILVIHVREAPLADLLAKIGDLTAADWQAKGEGFELVRSRAKQKAEEQAEFDREVAMFQKAIDKQKKNLSTLEPWTEQTATRLANNLNDLQKSQPSNGRFENGVWKRMQELDNKAPGGRAMTRILASLNAKELAALPADYKIVFSDRPTNMQRPLPTGVIPGLQQLVAEQNIWADVAGKVFGEPQGGMYSTASWMKQPFDGQVGKVLLMISKTKQSAYQTTNIEIAACNRKGTILVRGNQYLNTANFEDYKQPAPQPGEQPLPVSKFAEAVRKSFDRSTPSIAAKNMPKDIVDLLCDPEHHEPLAFATGELLISLAQAKGENLIAQVNDESFMVAAGASLGKMTPSMVLKMLSTAGLNVEEKADWLVISPQAAASSRLDRLDRAAIGRFVRATVREHHAGLEEQAVYAVACRGDIYNTLGYVLALLSGLTPGTDYFETPTLRLYGLMDAAQRQALAKGARINLGALSAAQIEVVNKMVFGMNPNLSPTAAPNNGAGVANAAQEFYNGIGQEPTEMFPNGIPRNSTLDLDIQADLVMISPPYEAAGGGMYGGRSLGADEVAQTLYAKERPGIFPWIDGDAGWDQRKFWSGNRRTLNFRFDFGGLASMIKQLQDVKYQHSDPIPYSQISPEFRELVQKKLEEMRKQYANVKPGQFGGTRGGTQTPPPRR
jgi:hypothetical protein